MNALLPRYAAFDIDGTLFSSESIIHEVYAQAIEKFNRDTGSKLEVPDRERIMKEIGKPVVTIFRNLLPEASEENRQAISDSVLDILCANILAGDGHFYDGAAWAARELHQRGIILLAASNGRRPYVETILHKAGIHDLFRPVVVLDGNTIKTKSDILLHYMNQYTISPEQIVMIGDRDSDFQAAKTAKCAFIFCAYGHANQGEITEYDFQAGVARDIVDFPSFK